MTVRRLTAFVCWWCRRRLPDRKLHHQVMGLDAERRRCCHDCYHDPEGRYRRVYVDERQERAEVGRVREAQASV